MSASKFKLAKAPIVEAVVDIDCDMPPGLDPGVLEKAAHEALQPQYPKFRKLFVEQHHIEAKPDQPSTHSAKRGVQAFQFLQEDEKQLVQGRLQGFSFNRLAPYSSLDDYLPEIERTWRLFVGIAAPVQVRAVRLRYINRILLPLTDGLVKLEDYLKIGPMLAEDNLVLVGFLNQYSAVETGSGHAVNVVVTAQPQENDRVPILLDNCVWSSGKGDPQDWPWILEKIQSLRGLKNRIFRNTLTERCLSLFQQ